MNIRWVDSKDGFGTATSQLCISDKVAIEIVQYEDDTCEFFGDLFTILPFESKYIEDMQTAKKYVESVIFEFCTEFNTWYRR